MSITEKDINLILENKEKMLSVLPTATHSHAYKDMWDLNYHWYCTVMALSENLSNSKKRSSKFNQGCNLDLKYLANMWISQNGRCALSGAILDHASGTPENKNPYRVSIDRIYNSQGYVKGNVRLLCHWTNNAKSTWDDKLFESFIKSTSMRYA